MPPTASIVSTAAILLLIAAAQKVVDPRPAAGALRAIGLRPSSWVVRVIATIEVGVASSVIVLGSEVAVVALAATYLGFGCFVVVALRSGTMVSSCGCFGHTETPPSVSHVVIDFVFAAVAAAWAFAHPGRSPLAGLTDGPGAGVPFVVLTLVLLGLTYATLTDLPRNSAVVRSLARRSAS